MIVRFDTVTSEILKVTPAGAVMPMPDSYERITGIRGDGEAVLLPSNHAAFDEEDSGDAHELIFAMPGAEFQRLLGYVASRYIVEKPTQGSCHDFGAYMMGHDIGHMGATRDINNRLPAMDKVQNLYGIAPNSTLTVGHPAYARRGPLQTDGDLHPDFKSDGHGPLSIVHTCLLLDSNPVEPMALQRMALDGPMGLTKVRTSLAYYTWAQGMCDGQWDGPAPRPRDIDLYHLDQW